ncbi:MAG: endonuclease III [Clostridiales bacterium]|jgi:endonuclease-3|nr:endonuclease III [Clostridiales bacterium]
MDSKVAEQIIGVLEGEYPDAKCGLNFSTPFELLTATVLSAQCTDKRVNEVTRELFKVASAPSDFAGMDYAELEKRIFSCGFYRNKARSIIDASRVLLAEYGGRVPDDFDALLKLPGVGRKTANVVMANAFNGNNIAVDTHVFRTARRLGLAGAATPEKVEYELCAVIPEGKRALAHHLLIRHGRVRCKSRRPLCGGCPLAGYCLYTKEISEKETPL